MRFMMLMYPGSKAETGALPEEKAIAQMMKYNEELTQAGVLLALDGLQPTAKGARIRNTGGKRSVSDGPFSEAKEVIGGYWMLQVKSRAEALEWATRCPLADGELVELRQVYEMSDFDPSPTLDETAQRVEAGIEANKKRGV
jgi:hypothetical protein